MEFTFALCVGVLTTAGIYLMLRAQTFPVIVGLTLLSYAVNLFLFASGRLTINGAAIIGESREYTDPIPQALVLTAIVIGFAMTAYVLILAMRARADLGNDQVDGRDMPQAQDTGADASQRRKKPTRTQLRDTRPRPEHHSS